MIINIQPVSSEIKASNADATLQPARFDFFSGNSCTVTPCMRRLGGDKVAMAITYAWKREPSNDDRQEMEAIVEKVAGSKPKYFVQGERVNPCAASQIVEECLAQRKPS
jgi:hypothetical protein